MSMWFYIQDGEQRNFTLEKMRSLAERGEVDRDTLVWKKGMQDWQPLIETELRNILPDEQPPPIPEFPTTYKPPTKGTQSSTAASVSTSILKEVRKRLLVTAKSKIWAHWLFWLFVPFGGLYSCYERDDWSLLPEQLIALLLASIPILQFGEFLQFGVLKYFFAILTIVALFRGAYRTTLAIEEARRKVGIEDPIEAEKTLIAESRRG